MFFLLLAAATVAAPTVGKTSAADDWHTMTITRVADSNAPLYLWVSAGDIDGDGITDEAVIKLDCDAGEVKQSSYQLISPRDLASGQSSGKRMHKPFVITKEWVAASSQLSAMKPTYDIKAMKGARAAASADAWSPLSLSNSAGLCPAAAASAATINKSKSNVKNN
jgi:hypothetical protein